MKRPNHVSLFGGLAVVGFLALPYPSAADVVTDWNALAVQFTNAAARPAPSFMLDMTMVHIAIHDAVQAYERRFHTYTSPIRHASGSPIAAAAAAAHDVLVSRFPSQVSAIDVAYNDYLTGKGLSPSDSGVAVGRQAALQIILDRASDGSFPANPEIFTGSTEVGQWRPTPPALAPMSAPWMGNVSPFAQRDTEGQLPEPPPPPLGSRRYARDYNEVKAMGRRTLSARTPGQTTLALFYSGNFVTILNGVLRTVATARLNDIGDSARLFALANISAADSAINAWNNKRRYNVWRPSTAILHGDDDGNHLTDADPAWLPLINDPPYPDYTSGANGLTSAVMRTLANFFGSDVYTFTATTNALEGGLPIAPRTYEGFSALAADVVDARVLLGIHFRFADVVARRQGVRSADLAFSRVLRPRRGHGHSHR